MIRYVNLCILCIVLVWTIPVDALSPAEELVKKIPDDVLGFVATSGGDTLQQNFRASTLGKIWYDENVQKFYNAVKDEIIKKIESEGAGSEDNKIFENIKNLVSEIVTCPAVAGFAEKESEEGFPVYAFAIIQSGAQKDSIEEAISKLESIAGEGDITTRRVGSVKMKGFDDPQASLYWGWIGDYLFITINDPQALAIKNLKTSSLYGKRSRYLSIVPGTDDILAVYFDMQRLIAVIEKMMAKGNAAGDFLMVKTVLKELGILDIRTYTARMGFSVPDIQANSLVEMPAERRGLLACINPIKPEHIDLIDHRADMGAAFNYDLAGAKDTVLNTIKNVIGPGEQYSGIEATAKQFDGIFNSLAGPIAFSFFGAFTIPESATGGLVMIAELKDPQVFEKSMGDVIQLAIVASNGTIQASTRTDDHGRKINVLAVGPLAIMQVVPCWAVIDNQAVIASNINLCKVTVEQISSKSKENSLRSSEAYKAIESNLPNELFFIRYVDSKSQFEQAAKQMQQFWPMMTMALAQDGINLPAVLPDVSGLADQVGPTWAYSWLDSKGLRSHYKGPGIDVSLGATGGGAMGLAILMPALSKTKQIAQRTVSATNLKEIGITCIIYADDHEGKFPPNLQELVEEYDLSEKSLKSPLKKDSQQGPDYIYIAGQDRTVSPQNILAYDNPDFCRDKVNILCCDGHVAAVSREELAAELKETYKRLGRTPPDSGTETISESTEPETSNK